MLSDKLLPRWCAAFALALAIGCSTEVPSDEGSGDDDSDQEESPSNADDDSTDDDETPPKKDSGTGASGGKKDAATGASGGGKSDGGTTKLDASSGSNGGSKSDASAGGGSGGGELPCEIAKLAQTHCGSCHGDSPVSADFSLTKLEHFQGASRNDDAKKMYDVAYERVTATDVKRRMPPASGKAFSAADLKTFGDWLKGGAKAGAACAGGTADAGTMEPTTGAKGGSGKAHKTPIEYDDPDTKCYKLTAFSKTQRTQKYSVPTTPDLYVAFNIKAPWQGKQYIRSFRSIIDNGPVLHHWLLFKQMSGGNEGVTENALGAHPDGVMLYGWAPGGDDMWFDPDVGMEADSNVLYQLEMHYNNKTGGPSLDASGVEICLTPNKPTHVAGLSWVGTDSINGTTATGRCSHTSQQPIHLIASQPHMHTKGKHMKVVLQRKAGMQEVIHDEPFDFEFQKAYIVDKIINPGDVLTTTCSFSSPARFGKGTNDEMCYYFSIHWPAGALASGGIGAVIHGPNTCLQ